MQRSGFPLDDDITHYILQLLPDFHTLKCTILTCKSFLSIFEAHPKAIVRSVAYNVTGATLPFALAAAQSEEDVSWDHPDNVKVDVNTVISRSMGEELERNAEAIRGLESLFSWRHKNRTSRSSQLTDVESWRFQRAAYRISYLSMLLGNGGELEDNTMNFLLKYSHQELLELKVISEFLEETLEWVREASQTGFFPESDDLYYCAPKWIWDGFEDLSTAHSASPETFHEHITINIMSSLSSNKTDVTSSFKTILDNVIGESDKCYICAAQCGTDLWDESNWDLLKGILGLNGLLDLLKGHLKRNLLHAAIFRGMISEPTLHMSTLMNEIFALKTSAYSEWKKEDPLCLSCISQILRDHLIDWWVDRRRKGGFQINENCWYGYNCRTQTHKYTHCEKLNVSQLLSQPFSGPLNGEIILNVKHFCEPLPPS